MKVDLAKRRRVMQRSQRLGHCVCEPRRPCPCDVFRDRGYCPCAGERPDPAPPESVRLTALVRNAGCASKIAPSDLEQVLSRLPVPNDPAVLSGVAAGDDAGIYRLRDDLCLVQTVDVMTPCSDDARTFGRICAANCLSDIYAMGGRPRTALSVLAFPSESLDGRLMYEMLAGAMEVFAEAGVALIGGHSIKDEEIKLGFAITGTVDPSAAVEIDAARPGDVLVLTKPLGAGVIGFCRQIGQADGLDVAAAERSMATLNRAAAEAALEVGVSAGTDVTGFGLFGHLVRLARHSGVTVRIDADALPAFDGVLAALRSGAVPGAVERNREYVGEDLAVGDGVDEALVELGFDAQTSGGLLLAVAPERLGPLLAALERRAVTGYRIGRVLEPSAGRIVVALRDQADLPAAAPADEPVAALAAPAASVAACCAPAGAAEAGSPLADAKRAFGALMRATGAAGEIDATAKELIHFALVVLARCGPCVQAHLAKARAMGITQAQLDEAAWCAVAMGGAPVRLFYEEALQAEHGAPAPGRCC